MTAKEYLKRLQDLKAFLKTYPEQKKIYSDIPVNRLIAEMKMEIWKEEEKANEQIGSDFNDWTFATRVPF